MVVYLVVWTTKDGRMPQIRDKEAGEIKGVLAGNAFTTQIGFRSGKPDLGCNEPFESGRRFEFEFPEA